MTRRRRPPSAKPTPDEASEAPVFADDDSFVLGFMCVAHIRNEIEFERWQQTVCRAIPRVFHSTGLMDEADYAGWRQAMVAARASERDIEVLAVFLVLLVLAQTPAKSDARRRHIEAIAEHLAETSMTVRVIDDVPYVRVEFPDRPSLH